MTDIKHLTDKEVEAFLDDLDKNKDGVIDYAEVENKLDEVHREIAPTPKPHHLHYEGKEDEQRHQFLRSIIGTDKSRIPRPEFARTVKTWDIPSLEQEKKQEQDQKEYMRSMPLHRRFRSYWAVHGPEWMFLALVVAMQLAFGIWQLVKYLTHPLFRPAFGWGVVVAKTSAGVLYPTFFFLILSMSRWFSTWLRRSRLISRLVNFDLSQAFHVKISIVALGFATLHAIGHLTGSFLYGSRPAQQDDVAAALGPDAVPRPYRRYVESLPGWTGLVAFGLFWTLAGLSMPYVRKKSYELFQLGHLLMFPIIGLLCAHGTAGLFQWPMFGYFLAFPTLLVICERTTRTVLGFYKIPAKLDVLDQATLRITATIPERRIWPYKAGQYIFLQVPKISYFQWHPFTISTCIGNQMQVHIKIDGDWTSKLAELGKEGESIPIKVGIDGPFGAPAQRFYDFDQSIIVGAGIGVTPFSGILADLQARDKELHRKHGGHSVSSDVEVSEKRHSSDSPAAPPVRPHGDYRRVDFHWIVPERNALLWFSDLLNTVSRSIASHSQDPNPHLDIRIQTHVTQKRTQISTHVYRWLLELHRTESHPESPLTGLINPTHFGRPDLGRIMDEHYEDMVKLLTARREGTDAEDGEMKVGVFFCGAPVIGYQLADRCRRLTARARNEGREIEYFFMMEVFG
ncbi:hypothetical protein W97_03825 [Coniosporium apollinis CBS 100218]|uniref:NADPH oxidase n=1 Tax=Coniosporium apollinis (strain CBS 100218) TaxID=1168221 RepID=R7YRR7_CONA1|nr:uncharacterized protein W97_03825 [Coniosporium apollinis CBS 100218]EON64592.1 hypothetical protein W97_03825 [Coniosporium apollinis CBS 100218]